MNAPHRQDDESLDALIEQAISGTLAESDDSRLTQTVSATTTAVAALDATAAGVITISPTLRDRLLLDAPRHLPASVAGRVGPNTNPAVQAPRAAPTSRFASLGWLAAAAGLALAAAAWWPRPVVAPVIPQPPVIATAELKLDQLLRTAADVVRLPWKGSQPGFENVTGEVVWSDTRQEGYMRLVGLAKNDPRAIQYQLWIIDPSRDKRPVDGGVFDIASTGEVLVPITAKLSVTRPEGFALTREQPGGVVVSKGPLLVIAARS